MSEQVASKPTTAGAEPGFVDILSSEPVVGAMVVAVATAAAAFIVKLLGDYIVEKDRRATNVRILAAYIDLAVENWKEQKMTANPGSQTGFRISKFDDIAAMTTQFPNAHGTGGERFTPFVPFSAHDDLSIDKVRELIGFLSDREIKAVVRYVELEALTHALARDFRSEYVRRAFTQKRKVTLLCRFSDALVRARCAAEHAHDALAPFRECPTCVWYLPWGLRLRKHYYKRCHTDSSSLSLRQCQLQKPEGTSPCRCF